MSTVAVTRLIDTPADDLWRAFTDLPARVRWQSTTNGVEVLTTGPFGPGTVWRESRTLPDGSAVIEEFKVDEASRPSRLTLTSPGIGVDYRITYTFKAVQMRRGRDCTAVTVRQEAVPTAPYGRVLALLFGGLAARTVEGALRRDLADLAAVSGLAGHGPAVAA
jgi:uncharacterized membrane protein